MLFHLLCILFQVVVPHTLEQELDLVSHNLVIYKENWVRINIESACHNSEMKKDLFNNHHNITFQLGPSLAAIILYRYVYVYSVHIGILSIVIRSMHVSTIIIIKLYTVPRSDHM